MRKTVLTILILLTVAFGYSQKKGSIQGRITDAEMNFEPLSFAHVSLKNADSKVMTNLNGNFELKDINVGNYTLCINYLGYETLEIPVRVHKNRTIRIDQSLAARRIDVDGILAEAASVEILGEYTTNLDK